MPVGDQYVSISDVIEPIVDWWVNVYSDLGPEDDAVTDLTHATKDRGFAKFMVDEFDKLPDQKLSDLLHSMGPEWREWVGEMWDRYYGEKAPTEERRTLNVRQLTEALGVLNLALREVTNVQVNWDMAVQSAKMAKNTMDALAKAVEEGSRGQNVGMKVDQAMKDTLSNLSGIALAIGEPELAKMVHTARRSLGLRYERMK